MSKTMEVEKSESKRPSIATAKGPKLKKVAKERTARKANGATKKAAKGGGPGSRGPYGSRAESWARTITLVEKKNPHREGTTAAKRYELYRKNKTVGDFLKAGGDTANIKLDAAKGYIKVSS